MIRYWLAALVIVLLTGTASGNERLSVGVLRLASSGPIFIAAERGYFAAAGLAVELRFFEAAQPVAVAAVAGDIDIGATGLTAGFYNLAGQGALRIIAAQSREEPGYHLVAYLVGNGAYERGLKQLADLPGHSVAITQVGSTFHYSIGLLAAKLGFPLARLRLVPLQSMPNMATALEGGQVDAALIPATVALPMVTRGAAHLLGWVGDETPWQLGAIFASAKAIAGRRAALAAFLDAYRRGARDFSRAFLKGTDGRPQDSAEAPALLQILARYTGQAPEQLRAGIPFVDPEARLLVDDIRRQVAWYQEQGLVEKSVAADALLDLSLPGGAAGAH